MRQVSTNQDDQLVSALHAVGVNFLMGGKGAESSLYRQPCRLIAELAQSGEARLRLSLIPLFLEQANQPLHTEAIARMVGVAKSTLYRHKRVREQLPSWKSKKADHQRRIAARLFKVDKIYGSFSNNGKKSRNKDIAKIMGSCVGYSPDIREWLQNKRTKTHGNPEIAVLEQLDSILKKLINEGRMPTNKAICRELEISSRTLKGYQKVRERLQDFRRSKPVNTTRENELRRRIQEEGEKLASQGRRVSQAEVARRIGWSVSGLKKYPLIKSLLIELKRNSKN